MKTLLRIAGVVFALAVIALPLVAVVNGWVARERFPLRTLRLTAQLQNVEAQALQATIGPFAKQGFFAVDLDAAQAAVQQLPWVEEAEVRRRWPDILEVKVVEHQPFALWGKDQLLSQRGTIYPRSAMGAALPKGLPLLDGDARRAPEVVRLYNESRELFATSGIAVRGLQMDRRGAWTMQLATGTDVTVGREDAKARIARFAAMAPRLMAEQPGRRLVRADLRYSNGFALQWSEAQPRPAAASPTQGKA